MRMTRHEPPRLAVFVFAHDDVAFKKQDLEIVEYI
jgi:hypothetical protein